MNLFRKKKKVVEEATFKSRVNEFWVWWTENADWIRESVDQDGGAAIQPTITEQVNRLGSGFAWVLGPHPEGKEQGHSFTLSPDGMLNYLFLTSYWLEHAPSIKGWHFYSSRQPSLELDGCSIRVGDFQLAAKELWLTPGIDEEREEIHITAWSPIFAEIEESQAYYVLFLLLDEALGENGVSQWLGAIEIKDDRLADSFPLSELPEQVELIKKKHQWKKYPLEDSYTGYQFKNPQENAPRKDMVTLTTQNPSVTLDYYEADGALDNPIPNTGASYQFIQIPITQFPDGEQVDTRAAIEDALQESLDKQHAGRILGGGLGRQYAYIDLLLFDGQNSLDLINESLDRQEVRKYTILPFGR
ncbi:hypothetical protein AAFN60_04550 [Roseibacillus persicicus]|uniref:hypothetical protein n=1 Tax=Roseibacillus persicicus TaxID=454148 RepID=UPI00398B01DF